jgi:hypothetical protein
MEDLVRYLDEFIVPTIEDFEKNPSSVRHAFLACVATFHGVDYLAHPKKPGNLRKQWCERSNDFKVVDEVAHAFKHVTNGKPRELKSKEVISRPGSFSSDFSSDFDIGAVTLENDTGVNLLVAVRGAAQFIREQIDDQT